MINNTPSRHFSGKRITTGLIVTFALLAILVFTQFTSAAQDAGATPSTPGFYIPEIEVSQEMPTEADLSAMPPSIERYIAGQSLPASVIEANGLLVARETEYLYLPMTSFIPSPGQIQLTAGRPNSANTWSLSWTAGTHTNSYDIEEADNPAFSGSTVSSVGSVTTLSVTKNPSPWNVYYFRVRGVNDSGSGAWSNTVRVVGAYEDDFEDTSTGWSMRRSTYREKVNGFYENGKYVMQVIDRWDWGLSSPLMPAPTVPYVIDFEVKAVNTANLLSVGMVFGGDWNNQTCPPGIGYYEWYAHTDCFNHFYNTNMIFYGGTGLKMLFERVDQLVFCPDCDGSAVKRLGDLDPVHNVKVLTNIDPEGWNHFRVEVREDNIQVFAAKRGDANLHHQFTYNDTRWVSSPYFGVFASTDEYNNSTWRFEYFKVTPLNN